MHILFPSLFHYFIYTNVFPISTKGRGGINDFETVKKQKSAVIKMNNNACIDHISVSPNVGHLEVVHGKYFINF